MNASLNNAKMNVVETASNGAVNEQTIFQFQQKGQAVTARYSGGGVNRGFLAGRIENNSLGFKYAQQHTDGNIYGGSSNCEIVFKSGSIVGLIENFNWEAGKGRNVFRKLDHFYSIQDIRELVDQFEDCTLSLKKWDHTAHMLVGLWYCKQFGFEGALEKMRFGVTAYNESVGTVNSDTEGYHETITKFWLMLMAEFVNDANDNLDLYNSFINSRYAKKDYILNFYDREKLFSKHARSSWVSPISKTGKLI